MTIHVARDGQEIGQYNQQVFNNLLEGGHLFPTDYFWVAGMEDWKPLSLARSYFGRREKCRHCGGRMTEQKAVVSGSHEGQTKCICLKCGHTEYHAALS